MYICLFRDVQKAISSSALKLDLMCSVTSWVLGRGGKYQTISLHGEDVHEHAKISPLWVEVILLLLLLLLFIYYYYDYYDYYDYYY